MLPSWAGLLKDGIRKRGRAFHSFINWRCLEGRCAGDTGTRLTFHLWGAPCSQGFRDLSKSTRPTWQKAGRRWGGVCGWCVGKASWRRTSFRWVSEEQEEFARSDRSVGGVAGRRKANAKAWKWEAARWGERILTQRSCRMQEAKRQAGEEFGQEACGQLWGPSHATWSCYFLQTSLPSVERPSLIRIFPYVLSLLELSSYNT